ncbi:MAG: hypothetical protein ABH884_01110 [Candidatus Komeilibacteria bacterium]
MIYQIATENGQVGHAVNNLQATIILGLKKGYGGFVQEKIHVMRVISEEYVKALQNDRHFLPFVIQDTVITYAYKSDDGVVVAEHEPALQLITDKSPLYAADLSEDEWKDLVARYVAILGESFQQFRVYVTYAKVETIILEQL